MRTYTRKVREGELLGPVDWEYDFASHGMHPDRLERCKGMLRQVEADPDKYLATTDGGIPRVGWGRICAVGMCDGWPWWRICAVGMYDGWPWWRPVPSVMTASQFGGEWHWFGALTDLREVRGVLG